MSSTLPPSPTSTPALATHRQPESAEVQPFQAGAWSQSHVGPGQAGGQRGGGGQDQPEVEGQAAEGVPQCQVLSQAAPNQELVEEKSTLQVWWKRLSVAIKSQIRKRPSKETINDTKSYLAFLALTRAKGKDEGSIYGYQDI